MFCIDTASTRVQKMTFSPMWLSTRHCNFTWGRETVTIVRVLSRAAECKRP